MAIGFRQFLYTKVAFSISVLLLLETGTIAKILDFLWENNMISLSNNTVKRASIGMKSSSMVPHLWRCKIPNQENSPMWKNTSAIPGIIPSPLIWEQSSIWKLNSKMSNDAVCLLYLLYLFQYWNAYAMVWNIV